MSLPEVTVIGSKVSTHIFIAKKEEPHIAPKIVRSKKIFDKKIYFLDLGSGRVTLSKGFIYSSLWPSHKYSA